MGRNDLCFCGSGKKKKKCHANINENSIAAEIIKFYKEFDNELQRNVFEKLNVKCKKGCCECCGDFFPISEVEFAIIMDYLMQEKGKDTVQMIIKKGLEQNEFFKREYPDYYQQLEEDLNGRGVDEALRLTIQNMPTKQGEQCVFLNDDASCSIYEVRPIICRTYGLCYRSSMQDDYNICSKIPCLKDAKKNMLCIDKYNDIINSAYLYKDKNGNSTIMRRQYPIFYFIRMYFNDEKSVYEYFKHPTIYGILQSKKENFYSYLRSLYHLK